MGLKIAALDRTNGAFVPWSAKKKELTNDAMELLTEVRFPWDNNFQCSAKGGRERKHLCYMQHH